MDKINVYQPCPCGSGRKYKFCCYNKQRASASPWRPPELHVVSSGLDSPSDGGNRILVGDLDAGSEFFAKGMRLMTQGSFKAAMPWFRKAIDAAPFIPAPYNNLVLCLLSVGSLEEAIRVQRKGLDASPLPNPFGMAGMASLLLINGDPDGAERWLEQALGIELSSAESCVKVCEVLARFKRHQSILDTADATDFKQDADVCFFTGVAAANLGLSRRALADLHRARSIRPKAGLINRYIQYLDNGSAPHTVLNDWPYLLTFEVCPIEIIVSQLKHNAKSWLASPVSLDVCEAVMNEKPDALDDIGDMLFDITHPNVKALLWAIVRGSFGTDQLRIRALRRLEQLGEVDREHAVKVLLKGEHRKVVAVGIHLNPEIRFGGTLAPELETLYIRAIEASQQRDADWRDIGGIYHEIMRAAPDFFPARHNHAVSLLHQARKAEAEPILRELIESHPEYLFTRATLLQILTNDERIAEAEQLLNATVLPAETHPDAMAGWVVAQILFYESRGMRDEARACREMLKQLKPKHPLANPSPRFLRRFWGE